jgi:hypothetical protein
MWWQTVANDEKRLLSFETEFRTALEFAFRNSFSTKRSCTATALATAVNTKEIMDVRE